MPMTIAWLGDRMRRASLPNADDHGVDHLPGSRGVAVRAEQVVAADGDGHHRRAEAGGLEPGEL